MKNPFGNIGCDKNGIKLWKSRVLHGAPFNPSSCMPLKNILERLNYGYYFPNKQEINLLKYFTTKHYDYYT